MRPDGVSDLRSGAHVHGGFGTGASDRPRMPTLGTHRTAGVEREVEVLRPLLFEMGLLFAKKGHVLKFSRLQGSKNKSKAAGLRRA